MKKIVSNVLVVSVQLIVGGLFLCILFSDNNEESKIVVTNNDNLNKMADSVSLLFTSDKSLVDVVDEVEVELLSVEEVEAQKAKEAEEKAKAEAEEKAKEEEEARRRAEIEASKPVTSYNSTTGHVTYTLSEADFNVVAGVVACEATSYDDALGVASVILNRTDSGSYPSTPLAVVAAPGQFSCYGYYINNPGRFASNRANYADAALRVALGGTRNNNFYSFNYVCSNPYGGCTQIGGGNWYY